MADRVQFILDRMAPIFRDMENLGVFEKVSSDFKCHDINHLLVQTEIRAIVRKRTDFEYLLRRRQQTYGDYHKYLSFELNLEELMMYRCTKAAQSATKEKKDLFRKLQSSFLRHICYVYERALRRFPGNMDLWNDYIHFLKTKGASNILNTVFGRALSLHPKQENLWLQAAMFELDVNCNTHAARVLLQRSLRINRDSEKLWLRYFQLEIWAAIRVYERRELLGLDNSMGDSACLKSNDLASEPCTTLALVVYRHAIGAIPSLHFAQTMLECCPAVTSISLLRSSVCDDIRNRHGNSGSYWISEYKRCVALCRSDAQVADLRTTVDAIFRCVSNFVCLWQEGTMMCTSLPSYRSEILSMVSNLLDIGVEVVGSNAVFDFVDEMMSLASALEVLEEFVVGLTGIQDFSDAQTTDVIIGAYWIQIAHKLWKLRCVLCENKEKQDHSAKCDINDLCDWLEKQTLHKQENNVPLVAAVWREVAMLAWITVSHAVSFDNAFECSSADVFAPSAAMDRVFTVIFENSLQLIANNDEFSMSSIFLQNILTFALLTPCGNMRTSWQAIKICVETIIGCPNCRGNDRADWALWYIEAAVSCGLTSFRHAVDFIECQQKRFPMAFAQTDLSRYYRTVLDVEATHLQHLIQTYPHNLMSLQRETTRLRDLISSATNKCGLRFSEYSVTVSKLIESVDSL